MILSGSWIVLALTLARIFPSKHPARRWSFAIVAYLCLSCISCIVVTIATCETNSGLLNQGELQSCRKGPGGFVVRNIFLFAATLACDTLLIIFSLILLSWMHLVSVEHRLVLIVLCGTALTLLYSISFLIVGNSHAISMGPDILMVVNGMGNTQTALFLFVSNLPVLCTCLHGSIRRLFRLSNPPSSGSVEMTSERQSSCSSNCSCYSDSPTPLTLTEISDLSCQPSPRAYTDSIHVSEASRPPSISPSSSSIGRGDVDGKHRIQCNLRD
ncbi:hypothetical protein CPB84DRAFT_1777763 [Gymnopilus junonius]|uniref:Uncharacterized protein n=1 Tax=Gymnopilus junonius TaxID=109634 RepID=A0A9P5TP95_GYMJU|nr:hypothetical protein CPB84DRAFT_1777763 [Gymnopilus junonius]